MAHKDWCGRPCCVCENPCKLDESMPCSPDCEGMNEDGTKNAAHCQENKCSEFGAEPGVCPVCDCGNIEYGELDIESELCIYCWSCKHCGASGREFHKLEFLRISVASKDGE